MSRSNTPPRQPGGWPKPVAQAPEANDPARQRIGFPLGRPQQEAPTIYPPGMQPPQAAYGLSGGAERGQYPYPPAFDSHPPADPRYQAQMAQRQGGYYAPPPQQHGHPQDGGQRMPMQPAPDPYAAHGQPGQQYGQPAQQQWAHDGEPDPHAYDQDGYPPGQGGWQEQPQNPYAPPAGADDLGYAAFGSQALFDSSYGQPATFARQPGGDGVDGFAQEQAVYETEEPRRRGGLFLIVGALVGAVAVGGGLAYGYKTLVGSDASGPTPVVKSETTPARLKPAEADGKKFPFAENKVYGRLSENAPPASPPPAAAEASAQSSDSDAADPSGTRKVATYSVGRDGTIAPPQPSGDSAASPAPSVPGLTLDHGPKSQPSPPPQPSRTAAVVSVEPSPPAEPTREPPTAKREPPATTSSLQDGQPVVVSPPPAKPAVIAKAPPPPKVEQAAPEAAEENVAALPPQEPARKAPPKRAAQPAAAAAPAPDGSAGYVAVLASVPVSDSSRMDALKMFADMQQKYGAVLQDKTPDVREANLGEKGVYHRLLVGPPGSREQANAVCSGLKSAGYPSCWIVAF